MKQKVKSQLLSNSNSPNTLYQVKSLLRPKHEPDKLLRLQPELLWTEKVLHGPMLALGSRLKQHAVPSLACASVIFLQHVVRE